MKNFLKRNIDLISECKEFDFAKIESSIPFLIEKSNKLIQDIEKEFPSFNEKLSSLESQMKTDSDNLKFLDYFLWGMFGDYKKKTIYEKSKISFDDYKNDLNSLNTITFSNFKTIIGNREKQVLGWHLKETNPSYQELHSKLIKYEELLFDLNSLDTCASNAISSIESAESTETLDMFTKSKTISVMSHLNNSSASSSIDELKRKSESFKHKYSSDLDSNNTFDTLFDIFIDSSFLDFVGSMMVLSSLSNSKSSIRDFKHNLQININDCKEELDSIYSSLNKMIEDEMIIDKEVNKYVKNK